MRANTQREDAACLSHCIEQCTNACEVRTTCCRYAPQVNGGRLLIVPHKEYDMKLKATMKEGE